MVPLPITDLFPDNAPCHHLPSPLFVTEVPPPSVPLPAIVFPLSSLAVAIFPRPSLSPAFLPHVSPCYCLPLATIFPCPFLPPSFPPPCLSLPPSSLSPSCYQASPLRCLPTAIFPHPTLPPSFSPDFLPTTKRPPPSFVPVSERLYFKLILLKNLS